MIKPLFQYHALNETGKKEVEWISVWFSDLLGSLEAICPAGRELSIVKTKLEEAAFFAKKSVSMLSDRQV